MTSCFIGVLGLLIFSMPASCLICSESSEYTASLTPGTATAFVDDLVTLTCSTNLQTRFPRWEINDITYRYPSLPPDYSADELKLEFRFRFRVELRCFFRIRSLNGSEVTICSDITTVIPAVNREEGVEAVCQFQNITFFNRRDTSEIHIGSVFSGSNCSIVVSFDNEIKENISAPENNQTVTLQPIEMYYGRNVTIRTNNSCDVCPGQRYFLPNMHKTEYISIRSDYTGPIINNLTNRYFNFSNNIYDPVICTYSELDPRTECLLDGKSCDFGKLRLPACERRDANSLVSIGGLGNGTEVSIFVPGNNDEDKPSNILLFNFIVLTCSDCDDNATCQDGECVCEPGYTGNGNECELIPTSSPSSSPSAPTTESSTADSMSAPPLVITIIIGLAILCDL